ncbi:hypothetical protein FYK55_10895 [Roseiconus nitratireducens]|uniref:Uncharacterized protein n=1 Tax=Roseiconus nitratireducens TaxID=2605748 RepID=A0A5M6DES2_9BACT|nr:hypothetical protein [Roseiconus nitratireducens]KAA5543695.1 hypothetical protein FYK55_10895 [Roseiconus nitratireducens]
MNGVRVMKAAAVAVFALSLAAPADAGCLHAKSKGCCEPAPACQPAACCEPAPSCEPCCQPAACCEPAAPVCPPPPVEVSFCVTDPETCCKYPVTVCVPAECEGQVPCYVGCRPGFLGRKVLTYKFECCDECVDVVITKFGRVIVRD